MRIVRGQHRKAICGVQATPVSPKRRKPGQLVTHNGHPQRTTASLARIVPYGMIERKVGLWSATSPTKPRPKSASIS